MVKCNALGTPASGISLWILLETLVAEKASISREKLNCWLDVLNANAEAILFSAAELVNSRLEVEVDQAEKASLDLIKEALAAGICNEIRLILDFLEGHEPLAVSTLSSTVKSLLFLYKAPGISRCSLVV